MNDEDLEALLRRYRPVGPPASLRAAVVGANQPARVSVGEWSAIAASMRLAATFYWLAGIERSRVDALLGPERDGPFVIEEPLP